MKSTANIVLLLITATALAESPAIQRVPLDDHAVIAVPVATNRVTTISFPSAIEAIDGLGFSVDGRMPGQFQLAHLKGSAFFSVRALNRLAAGNLNIRWNHRTYVFEFSASDVPVLALDLESPPPPAAPGTGPAVSPLSLLALLDKAKAFPLLKSQHPESVADVSFTTYEGQPSFSDFNDYEIRIEQAFRFDAEDTLIFRANITNKTDQPLSYQPESFMLRAGCRLYPQSLSDASGTVPSHGQEIIYFAVTGTPAGGRNELSLKNNFTVLVQRRSPAVSANVTTNLPPANSTKGQP